MFKYTIALLLVFQLAKAQISPPGLGEAHTAEWLALGLNQTLDSNNKWQSFSYVGYGRKSNPDNFNLLQKSGIWVLNQEFYYQFHKKWQSSLAVSYRLQDEYSSAAPFEHSLSPHKQEFRLYGRLTHSFKVGKLSVSPAIRQEFRKFYLPDFKTPEDNFQLRSRFKLKGSIPLQNSQKISFSSEQLFSAKKSEHQWSKLEYKESRFTLYYSKTLKSVVLNAGYMYNLIYAPKAISSHYLALDITLLRAFKKKKTSHSL